MDKRQTNKYCLPHDRRVKEAVPPGERVRPASFKACHPFDLLVTGIFPALSMGRSKTGCLEFLLLSSLCPLVGGWLKGQTQRKKGIKTKDGYFTDGIKNWRPKGTEGAEPWRKQEGGWGGWCRDRQTDAYGCPGQDKEEGVPSHEVGSGSAHGRAFE